MTGTKVKICGLSEAVTMDAALEAGAAMVGLVSFENSPRHVDRAHAAVLADQARGRAQIVVLTVDADDHELAVIVENVRPDWLQLHGHEGAARIEAVKTRFGVPVIKAVGIADAEDAMRARDLSAVADLVLLDAKPPKGATRPGGLGTAFDWSVLHAFSGTTFMLAGGLTPHNVIEALQQTHAAYVDVSSGVETAPGAKDTALIRRFVANVDHFNAENSAQKPARQAV